MVTSELLDAFLSSSLLEEFFKWFILFYAVYQHVEFDEPFDGIVYGVAVSLGFATIENIFYLIANGIEHAMARALLPVSSHALFGVIMGFYIGKAKFVKSKLYPWLALLLALLFHLPYMGCMTIFCSRKNTGFTLSCHLWHSYGG